MNRIRKNYHRINQSRKKANTKNLNQYIREEILTSDGKAIIDIDLKDIDFFHRMSYGNHLGINPEITDYIDSKANLIPVICPIIIRFHHCDITEEMKEKGKEVLHHYYYEQMQDKAWDAQANKNQGWILFFVGMAFLTIYLILSLQSKHELFVEFISVIGSFALWESADRFLLESRHIKNEMNEIAQYLEAEIEFLND